MLTLSDDFKAIRNLLEHTKPVSKNYSLNPITYKNSLKLFDAMDERVKLAIKAINLGGDPIDICAFLDWREFELLCFKVLQLFDYDTLKGFVFNCGEGRFQIDVLASKNSTILSIDCKHWFFPYWTKKIKEASKAHSLRTKALTENIKLLGEKLSLKTSRKLYVIPILLVLGDPRFTCIEDIPVISLLKLKDFLNKLPYPPYTEFKYYITKPF